MRPGKTARIVLVVVPALVTLVLGEILVPQFFIDRHTHLQSSRCKHLGPLALRSIDKGQLLWSSFECTILMHRQTSGLPSRSNECSCSYLQGCGPCTHCPPAHRRKQSWRRGLISEQSLAAFGRREIDLAENVRDPPRLLFTQKLTSRRKCPYAGEFVLRNDEPDWCQGLMATREKYAKEQPLAGAREYD